MLSNYSTFTHLACNLVQTDSTNAQTLSTARIKYLLKNKAKLRSIPRESNLASQRCDLFITCMI